MYTSALSEIIEQISVKKYLDATPHPVTTLQSIKSSTSCSTCQILKEVCDDLHQQQTSISEEYNQLLQMVNQLIELTVRVVNENRDECEQLALEIEQSEAESCERDKEMRWQLQEKQKSIIQLRFLLLERDEEITELEERKSLQSHERSFFKKENRDLEGKYENMKNHKRQKSQQCVRLETLNLALQEENLRIVQENRSLREEIKKLNDYVCRMEDDLASHNIKSPRMLAEVQQDYRTLTQDRNDSIEEESSIDNSSSAEVQVSRNRRRKIKNSSVTSSFMGVKRPLKEILNISGESSKFFQFRTLERADLHQNSAESSNQNQNTINLQSLGKSKETLKSHHCPDNIKQIHEFLVDPQAITVAQKKDDNPSMTIDPYYAFFQLTIQCIKLNWKNLNQVANVDLSTEWQNISQIPFNKWAGYLKDCMKKAIA